MVTCASASVVAGTFGCVAYAMLYSAFASRNQHMGFHGDFEEAAASCGKMAVFFALVAVGGLVGTFGKSLQFQRRQRAKTRYGDVDDGFAGAMLPGSYNGLRKR